MTKPSLILIGAVDYARSYIDVIEQQDYFQSDGLVGLSDQQHAGHFGYAAIGEESDLPALAKIYQYALIIIGKIKTSEQRMCHYQKATQLRFQLPNIIAPTSHVRRQAAISACTNVMHGVFVNAGAKMGNNCIISNRALIEHDSIVADHRHISPGNILNGNLAVGMGLNVKHNLNDNSYFARQGSHE